MKSRFLLLVLAAAAISSCSTSYKSGQTPDDVYYSPAKEAAEYVEIKESNNSRYRGYEYDNADDRWLRMRVRCIACSTWSLNSAGISTKAK